MSKCIKENLPLQTARKFQRVDTLIKVAIALGLNIKLNEVDEEAAAGSQLLLQAVAALQGIDHRGDFCFIR